MKEPLDLDRLKDAFRETPPAFKAGMEETLFRLQTQKEEQPVKKKISLALAIALIAITLLAGVACAASLSPTIDWFGWFYGKDFKDSLENGDVAAVNQSTTLGDLNYTLYDVVYAEGVLYGTGVISVAEGKDAVLMTEDYSVDEPAGYMLHLGDETIPDDAPTYAALARQKGCKILLGKLVPDGYIVNGELYTGDIGYSLLPRQDGTVEFAFEIYVGDNDPSATALPADPNVDAEDQQDAGRKGIQRSQSYTLSLYISNWEVSLDGQWLREEPQNTWLKQSWEVTVTPEIKE